MGLFDFIKGTGNKVFSSNAQANQKIEEHIRSSNPGIKDLKVAYKNSTAFLSGEAESPEALQKAVLMAGNLQGVELVNVDRVKIAAQPVNPQEVETHEGTQFYIIQSGDTLSKIAQRFYGDPAKYSLVFDFNREVIQDPNLIFPGQKIRIPPERRQQKAG